MDLDGPFEGGADFPDRVELGIVDRQETAVLVANAQAERLVKFQALGSCLKTLRAAWRPRDPTSLARRCPEKLIRA